MARLLPIDRFLVAALAALTLCIAPASGAENYREIRSPTANAPAANAAPTATVHPPESLTLTMSAHMQSAAGQVMQSAKDITDSALDLIGVRYKFGGQSPERGMDCSGFVRYVFEQVTGVELPRSAREQAKVGEIVGLDQLKPGDLVFFNTRRHAFSHVGIYLGDNSFIHSPSKKGSVRVTNIDGRYWKARFNGARRLLGVMPGLVSIEAAKSLLQSLPSVTGATVDNSLPGEAGNDNGAELPQSAAVDQARVRSRVPSGL